MRYPSGLIHERILRAATELFLERGFEGASMMEISARVGGSKQTLYNHFSDKSALFSAAMIHSIEGIGAAPAGLLEGSEPLQVRMVRFANARFAQVAKPFALGLRRVLLADAVRIVEGPRLHGLFFEAPWSPVALQFETMMRRGELKPGCGRLMARHFRNLLEAEVMPSLVMGAPLDPDFDPAASAVEAFLSAYAA
jgi:AcrR family transcriptional regulator